MIVKYKRGDILTLTKNPFRHLCKTTIVSLKFPHIIKKFKGFSQTQKKVKNIARRYSSRLTPFTYPKPPRWLEAPSSAINSSFPNFQPTEAHLLK